MVEYFRCSFAQPINVPPGQDFPRSPDYVCEKGVWHWVNRDPDDPVMRLVPDPEDASRYCLWLQNPAGSGTQHNKLYEVQERSPSRANYVEPYLTRKEAYWRFTIRFPSDLVVSNWRLIFQLCGYINDYAGTNPQTALIIHRYHDSLDVAMAPWAYADNRARHHPIMATSALPRDRFVEFILYMRQGNGFRTSDGIVTVWMDRQQVFHRTDLPTATSNGTPYIVWGIGNYGPREATPQSLWFKDVTVTSEFPTDGPVPPTHAWRFASTPAGADGGVVGSPVERERLKR